MDAAQRRHLQAALRARYPWVDGTEFGPAAVEAGECDRCNQEARLVQTCGPGAEHYLGRSCADKVGEDGWCAGHAESGQALLVSLAALPPEADTVARLWWVATGEVRLDPALHARLTHLGLPGG